MKAMLLSLALLCPSALWGQSFLHLTAGESYSYEFSTVPFIQPQALLRPTGAGIFYLSDREVGTELLVEMFENREDAEPIRTSAFTFSESDLSALGRLNLSVSVGRLGSWQDLEGRMRLTVLSGGVDLTGMEVRVAGGPGPAIDFNLYGYGRIIPVPEPSTWFLLSVGLVAIGARTFTRRRGSDVATRCSA